MQQEIFETNKLYKNFLPKIQQLQSKNNYSENIWDISHTISQLSYYVHSHYRYYGKFPSVVAGQILEQYASVSNDEYVFDNFCGSGTSMVECRLRGLNSVGVDISWLSVLASNVKVTHIDTTHVFEELKNIIQYFYEVQNNLTPKSGVFLSKWFNEEIVKDLTILQSYLLTMKKGSIKDFLVIAFLGILRRVSKAYDGEVRPHINKDKKQRDTLSAFSKKVKDMCSNHNDFQKVADFKVESQCYLANNTNLPEILQNKKCSLVISHPPYLNSFNYKPVYSLEFYWGKDFEKQYVKGQEELYYQELQAHPANEKIIEKYFKHLENCYKETYKIQPKRGKLAIVIGDCTRNGKLINVLDKTIQIANNIGYKTIEVNYRTTHFGLGKYAYRQRADYHGNAKKKDGILIFEK